MRIKTNWEEYIHSIRKREIEIIFSKFAEKSFESGLEIGAGEGFQSILLSSYVQQLISTEYNEERLKKWKIKTVNYKICDAEIIDEYFDVKSFDLIFASNVLEHLKNREQAMNKIHTILKDDGILIAVVPNLFIKLCYLSLFYPNQFIEFIEVLKKGNGFKKIFRRIVFNSSKTGKSDECEKVPDLRNNRRSPPKNFITSLFFPTPHGEYISHFEELLGYRKKKWLSLLENSEFKVAAILKMPVASGYGFGFDSTRKILEKMGLSSAYAFIAHKKGKNPITDINEIFEL